MKNIVIDNGMEEFCVNGRGVLRFNPRDPNLYHRFLSQQEKLNTISEEIHAQIAAVEGSEEERNAKTLALMSECDTRLKAVLNEVFAPGNDFNALLEGVNLAGVAGNGKTVIVNLLDALRPLFEQGRKDNLTATAALAAAEAEQARRSREAQA